MKKVCVFILALSTTFFISCESDDKVVDQVLNDFTVGAILRTRNQEGNPYNAFVPGSIFTVTLEEQDAEFGGLLHSIQVYATFTDNQDDPTDSSVSEQLIETFMASDLATSSRGLPELTYTTTLAESATTLGVGTGYSGGDVFSYRFEVTLTDGSTWTNVNGNGNVLGGSYFNSPYKYDVVVACIPTGPVPGDYTLDMQDSYGDGWNGASIRVTVDGVATDYTISSAQGASNTEVFTIPDTATTVTFEYVSGDWDSEVTYQLFAPNGKTAFEDGPSPFIGDFTGSLSICP
ncbi:hypothetical protein [Muriicola sp.]|uniref:hypothetical protein n=1 Tax=Muriicola sp. TaxID=2020856 RepID=UPI003C76319F